MNIWNELGIEPTGDAAEIRRAYAARLRQVHPEDDAAGFQRLRQAYEHAMAGVAAPAPSLERPASPPVEALAPAAPTPSPFPPVMQSAASLLERLLETEAAQRLRVLVEVLGQEGWGSLDFRVQLQKTLARILMSNFERLAALVEVFDVHFGWGESSERGLADPLIAELVSRSRARRWRTGIESDNSRKAATLREALGLLCRPVDETAFGRFAREELRVAEMRRLLQELHRDHPAVLRYETNQAAVEWWLKYVRPAPSAAAAAPPAPAPRKSGGSALLYVFLVLGGLRGLAGLGSGSGTAPYEPPAHSAPAAPAAVPHLLPLQPAMAGSFQLPWSAQIHYHKGDRVSYEGRNWRALADSLGTPPNRSLNWLQE